MSFTKTTLNRFFVVIIWIQIPPSFIIYAFYFSVDNSTQINSGILKDIVHIPGAFQISDCPSVISTGLGMVGQDIGSVLISLGSGGETGMPSLAQCCWMCYTRKDIQMRILSA